MIQSKYVCDFCKQPATGQYVTAFLCDGKDGLAKARKDMCISCWNKALKAITEYTAIPILKG